MAPTRLHRLVGTAAAADYTKRSRVDRALRGQERQRGVDVSGHPLDDPVTRRAKVGERFRPAPAKAAEVKRQHVISGDIQHRRQLVVDVAIGVALVQQENAWAALIRRVKGALERESVGSGQAYVSLFTASLDGRKENEDAQGAERRHRSISTSFTSASRSTRNPMLGVPISSQLWPP